jgi:DNA end-binding protein Ku
MGKALVMQQLRGADEVKPLSEIPIPDAEVRPQELELAKRFVESLASGEFKPDKYEDVVRKRLQEIIQKKIDGEQVSVAPVEQPKGQIIDLMEALKASLAQHDAEGAKTAAPKATPAAAPAPVQASVPAPAEGAPAKVASERKPTRKAPAKPAAKEAAPREGKKSRSAR